MRGPTLSAIVNKKRQLETEIVLLIFRELNVVMAALESPIAKAREPDRG